MPGPAPLHLPRLAAAQSDTWVALPAGEALVSQHVLQLTRKLPGQQVQGAGEWVLCLSGEVVIDLPAGQWLRLQAGETVALPAGVVWSAVPMSGEAVLLRSSGTL
ncbi:cupin domain-containing protein [Deinococcus radiophilus]|uniref:cupin domain-containing protein n=1 Tax=Deinococcus radiophilus TaxID=32062 RepID=UPI001B87EC5D|nr:cupin domain-containing protein [Deinococcus radiophilus]UFA50061.1 cupin domain-containing protein [Deinococcus radiophilus]